ncbi:hypothetical protein OC842_000652 [Tilletia horrida]|uniref:Protein-tyrosine-phosphatase n=1 Tax=Tilletia horrida TaxID=155126 RepID=A0AAN6GLE5_9BASI|nr:hypothetical protein OC842_000652 [Tilletia horrida]
MPASAAATTAGPSARGSPHYAGGARSAAAGPGASSHAPYHASTLVHPDRMSSSGTLYHHHDDTESGTHHASSSLAGPPLLLPPPAFATVAPDIYRCSSSFPTPQDITSVSSASVRETRSQSQGPQQQHLNVVGQTASSASSVNEKDVSSAAAMKTDTSTRASSSSTSLSSQSQNLPAPSPLQSPSLHAHTGSSSTAASSPAVTSTCAASSTTLQTGHPPSSSASVSGGGGGGVGGAGASNPTTTRPRSRVNSNSSTTRHTSALSAAAALYTPFLDSLVLRTVLVLGWERPSKTLVRYCRERGVRVVHLGLDGSRIGPPRAAGTPGAGSGTQHALARGRAGLAPSDCAFADAVVGGIKGGREQMGRPPPQHEVYGIDSAGPSASRGGRVSPSSAASSAGASMSLSRTESYRSAAPLSSSALPYDPGSSGMTIPAPRGGGSGLPTMNAGPSNYAHLSPHLSPALGASSSAAAFGPVPGSANSSMPGSNSSSLGSSSIHPHQLRAVPPEVAGTVRQSDELGSASASAAYLGSAASNGVTASLFSASASQAGFISERMVKDGLEIILDKKNHPVMIMDTSGIQETGVLVGCLRRMQRWDFASILVEYRSFAGTRSRTVNERFIEMFDTDLTNLPPQEDLPPFFSEHLLQDEEELDALYGF